MAVVQWGTARICIDTQQCRATIETLAPELTPDKKPVVSGYEFPNGGAKVLLVQVKGKENGSEEYRLDVIRPGLTKAERLTEPIKLCSFFPSPDGKLVAAWAWLDKPEDQAVIFVVNAKGEMVAKVEVNEK